MRRRPVLVATAGAAALVASLFLPWFDRRVSQRFEAFVADRTFSGWAALGGLSAVLLVAALAAAAWAAGRLPAFGLVLAGAAALMVQIAVAVERVGSADAGAAATSPAGGLLLAFAGATAVLLVGLTRLLAASRVPKVAAAPE